MSEGEAGKIGGIGRTRIYRKGNTYYYVVRRPNGGSSRVIVQLPDSQAVTSGAAATTSTSGQSLPQNVATEVLSAIGNTFVKGVLSGGAVIGKLMATRFPLMPILLGLFLVALGFVLRNRRHRLRFRFATKTVS